MPSLNSVHFPGHLESFTRILSPTMGLWVAYDNILSACPYEILNRKMVGPGLYMKSELEVRQGPLRRKLTGKEKLLREQTTGGFGGGGWHSECRSWRLPGGKAGQRDKARVLPSVGVRTRLKVITCFYYLGFNFPDHKSSNFFW